MCLHNVYEPPKVSDTTLKYSGRNSLIPRRLGKRLW